MTMPRWPKQTIEERFLSKLQKTNSCWLWIGGKKENGYGTFGIRQPNGGWSISYAHRFSYELFRGAIPEGLYVCHSCDVRCCVNPEHLWLGTHKENQADMGRKGRTFSPAKRLTDAGVAAIRVASGNNAQIAKQFGVARSYVSRLRSGKRRPS